MSKSAVSPLTARGESPAAFGRRCIPSGCVAPRSNTPGILARRALPDGRIAALGATLDFHHGLLDSGRRLQRIRLVRTLPGEFWFRASEVTEGRGLPVDRSAEVELLDDAARRQFEVLANNRRDRLFRNAPGPFGVHH